MKQNKPRDLFRFGQFHLSLTVDHFGSASHVGLLLAHTHTATRFDSSFCNLSLPPSPPLSLSLSLSVSLSPSPSLDSFFSIFQSITVDDLRNVCADTFLAQRLATTVVGG